MKQLLRVVLAVMMLSMGLNVMAQAEDPTPVPEPPQLLAWVAAGTAPGAQSPDNPGEIVLMDADGNMEAILNVPTQAMMQRVVACGESADGRTFAFYIGNENQGTITLLDEDNTLITLANDVSAMSCVGMGTLQFSADGSRVGYLDFSDNFTEAVSPRGRLVLADATNGEVLDRYENVAAFNLSSGLLTTVNFYDDNDGKAVEIAINADDGQQTSEVATLFADTDNDCFYNSASISPRLSNQIAVVLGYRCTRGDVRDTQWQFHLVDTDARSATLVQSGTTIGRFFPFTRTNTLVMAPDGATVFFTVPDGLYNNSVSLKAMDLASSTVRDVVPQYVAMPSVSILPYDARAHAPLLSPDGRWLAVVTSDPNSNADLNVIDLNAPNLPPINISAGSSGDTVVEMGFSGDGSALYFIAGGTEGGDNVLFQLELASGNAMRLNRGHYGHGVLDAESGTMALIDWRAFADDEAPQLTLVEMNLADNSQSTMYESGTIVEGKLTDASFIYPLAWR
ncbi:MAG: hypothetical protein CL607_11340 [Anaerolineaceae bacterium]|nr:hypothetical protein [Anaerolineaceae bacterium]